MADLSDPIWWKGAIVAVLTEPLLGPLLVLIGVAAWTGAWKLKGSIDDGEIRTLQRHLAFAKDREEAVKEKRNELEKQVEQLRIKVAAGAPKEELASISGRVDAALLEFKAANNAVHHVLMAEPGKFSFAGSDTPLVLKEGAATKKIETTLKSS